jgi:uncharacterized repeat protein (TIGR03803 family)
LLPAEIVRSSSSFQQRGEEEGNSMRQKDSWYIASVALAVTAAVLVLAPSTWAATYKILHKFTGKDGANPLAGLILDGAGNLYGTTEQGGAFAQGTVFKLKPNADGTWTENVLHSFCSLTNCADGQSPTGRLIFDAEGNLYGTTAFGAASEGMVFKLTPNSDGSWTESVLYGFLGGSDGSEPSGGLILDAGTLYGTTIFGGGDPNCGSAGCGTVFKLAPNADGSWTESVLHSFTGGVDGVDPNGDLIFDATGNLYGTTYTGGASNGGTVFKLAPNADGSWTESVLHSFTGGPGGVIIYAGLIVDATGNLYGTTYLGGNSFSNCRCGVVFKLTPRSDGSWKESVLHAFAANPAGNPRAGLVLNEGSLYGTTANDGNAGGDGAVFKLAPKSGGGWAYNVLHTFQGKPAIWPFGSLLDKAGNLYGTTSDCASGTGCHGVVFEITP